MYIVVQMLIFFELFKPDINRLIFQLVERLLHMCEYGPFHMYPPKKIGLQINSSTILPTLIWVKDEVYHSKGRVHILRHYSGGKGRRGIVGHWWRYDKEGGEGVWADDVTPACTIFHTELVKIDSDYWKITWSGEGRGVFCLGKQRFND